MQNKRLITEIGIIALIALLLVMGGFFWGVNSVKCPACIGSTVVEIHDSFAPSKDTGVITINNIPKLKESRKFKGVNSTNYIQDSIKPIDSNYSVFTDYTNLCLDTNIFTVDTTQVDNFKARATATVTNNKLIGLQIEYQNFKPEKWKVLSKTITVEKKQPLLKVFPELYARTSFNSITVTGGGAGGGASFIVKDRHLVGIDAGANKSIGQPISGEVLLRYGFKIHLK